MSEAPPTMQTNGGAVLPDRVIVSCTATLHGKGTVRLPNRLDAEGPIAAFLVETSDEARKLLREVDARGRTVFVDVERKQAVDLPALARECVQLGVLRPHKPNDATVRSLDVLVTHLVGFDLTGQTMAVLGTGNLGFKAALLLAERGANVQVQGRDPEAAHRVAAAITSVMPRHGTSQVTVWQERQVDVLVTALSARGAVGGEWAAHLSTGANAIDAGIGNLSTDFLERALAKGARVVRLDTRTTGSQLVTPAPGFFERSFGQAEVGGVKIVSGGIIGLRGTVVVDSYVRPTRILGLADGQGGLLSTESITDSDLGGLAVVEELLQQREAGL